MDLADTSHSRLKVADCLIHTCKQPVSILLPGGEQMNVGCHDCMKCWMLSVAGQVLCGDGEILTNHYHHAHGGNIQ